MNELIKELKREAEALAYEEHKANCIKNGRDPSMPHANALNMTFEKFAELIVKECVNRIEQNRSSGENTDSWTITRDMAFHQMKEDLKKHFGVEE